MLPREQDVPAGGTSFYLNNTWPETVTADTEPAVCATANSTSYDVCPSAGYDSLSHTLTGTNYFNYCTYVGTEFAPLCQARGAEGNRQWRNFLIQSPSNLLPPMLNGIRGSTWSSNGTSAVQPHAATTAVMYQLRNTWMKNSLRYHEVNSRQYEWTYQLKTLGSATNPFVRTKCTLAQNLSADADIAMFPYLIRRDENTTDWALSLTRPSSIVQLQRDESTHIRTQWLPLAIEDLGDVVTGINTAGLLIELPWVYGSRAAIGCAIAAAWHNSTVRSERSTSYDAFSIALTEADFLDNNDSPDYDLTNKPVTLDTSWLELVTPAVPTSRSSPDNYTLNSLETILLGTLVANIPQDIRKYPDTCTLDGSVVAVNPNETDVELWTKESYGNCRGLGLQMIEEIIAMTVIDGLSRYGSYQLFTIHPALRDWRQNSPLTFNESGVFAGSGLTTQTTSSSTRYVSTWLTVSAFGYAYYPSTRADYLALFGVCVYLFVALSHIIYSIFRRSQGTSTAWDSVTELLVLCQNSPAPTTSHMLDNTSAGIEQLKTYQSVVKVRAFPAADGVGTPRVRLVLDDDSIDHSAGAASMSVSNSSGKSLRKLNDAFEELDIELADQAPSSSSKPNPQEDLDPFLTPFLTPTSSVSHHLNNSLRQTGLEKVEVDNEYG